MTASIYASRYKINHLIFGAKVGGQFIDAHIIENYPGFTSITGAELAQKFREHVASYGVMIREEKIGGIKVVGSAPTGPADPLFELSTEGGENVQTRSIILAMGAQHRALNIPGEQNFLGRGVSYCATCDAPLFSGKTVAVVGGGNSAITAALHLSEFASKVYVIHRRDKFDKADPVWLSALEQKQNITKIYNAKVTSLQGDKLLKSLKYLKTETNYEEDLPVDGVFVEIGLMPAASLANQVGVSVDLLGYITTKGDLATNVPGVFAAGDLVKQSDVPSLRQMITSAAQGAIAATSVYAYLNKKAPAPDWG